MNTDRILVPLSRIREQLQAVQENLADLERVQGTPLERPGDAADTVILRAEAARLERWIAQGHDLQVPREIAEHNGWLAER